MKDLNKIGLSLIELDNLFFGALRRYAPPLSYGCAGRLVLRTSRYAAALRPANAVCLAG
jgi:hypothetical protein